MKDNRLYQATPGVWFDLFAIVSLQAAEASDIYPGIGDRVIVTLLEGKIAFIPCESFAAAVAKADEIGNLCAAAGG